GSTGERIARTIGRRDVLKRTLRGATVVLAGTVVGSFSGMKQAWAASNCNSPDCGPTKCVGTYLLPAGTYCPTGRGLCKLSSGCGGCPSSSGTWVACTGLGHCGGGFWLCADCKHTTSCSGVCQQLSGIYCSGCCIRGDVEREVARLNAALAA